MSVNFMSSLSNVRETPRPLHDFVRQLLHTAFMCMMSFAVSLSAFGAEFQKLSVKDGTLLFEDGSDVNLWGVNFQPSLSWEYQRMVQQGLHDPFNKEAYQSMINEGFDEIQRMGCNLIRLHLSPSDFSDAQGALVENRWLDMTSYVLAEAEKRGIYIYLALLNNMHSGFRIQSSFAVQDSKTKANWMVDPDFMGKADRFIMQFLNHSNPYCGNRKVKDSPALVILEPINEPGYFKREEIGEFPACEKVYLAWLDENSKRDSTQSFSEWRIENTRNYINRMVAAFKENVPQAVMSWSMEWPRMMEWTGADVFEAAVKSDAEVLSVCLYPGQGESHNRKGDELRGVGEINYLPYLQQTYDDRSWHGWLRDKSFKNKARIVYEFETYYNQTSYLYPAMAKYFRAQGIQAAAMWTYILPGEAEYTAAAHNLNLKTTPNKAAAFMAAGEVFRNTPRFERYNTSSPFDDFSDDLALSHKTGSCAYADKNTLIYSETIPENFVRQLGLEGRNFKRIIGRGNSPQVSYEGSGLYFIEPDGNDGLCLEILPDAEWQVPHYLRNAPREQAVRLSTEISHSFELHLPLIGSQSVVMDEKGNPVPLQTAEPGLLKTRLKPGIYRIQR